MQFQRLPILLISLGLVSAMPVIAETNLSQTQQKIKQQESKIAEQRKKRDSLQSTLKNQEIEMGRVLDKLQRTEMSLSEIRKTIKNTEQEIQKLEKQEAEQKERLKAQLDSAYRSGIHPSVLERLLSEDAKEADRMSTYYKNMNQVRIDAIYELRKTQAELKARRDELRGQQKGQQVQLSDQKKQEKELKKVQNERETTLRTIDKDLAQDENRLDALRSNEKALRDQLAKAKQEAERQEKEAIAKLEAKTNKEQNRKATEQEKQQVRAGSGLAKSGKYMMPVSGKVVTPFGNGWNGIVIQAPQGSPVRAIAAGRVIIADWLQGYGQMVGIDHGNGDISLYGFNQSLSVRKGSRVQAGQVIASVGNSGGQSRAALYFGITQKGAAVNPLQLVR